MSFMLSRALAEIDRHRPNGNRAGISCIWETDSVLPSCDITATRTLTPVTALRSCPTPISADGQALSKSETVYSLTLVDIDEGGKICATMVCRRRDQRYQRSLF